MDIGLRDWLVIGCGVLIGLIILDGWRRSSAKRNKLKMDIDPNVADLPDEPVRTHNPELPNGGARVVGDPDLLLDDVPANQRFEEPAPAETDPLLMGTAQHPEEPALQAQGMRSEDVLTAVNTQAETAPEPIVAQAADPRTEQAPEAAEALRDEGVLGVARVVSGESEMSQPEPDAPDASVAVQNTHTSATTESPEPLVANASESSDSSVAVTEMELTLDDGVIGRARVLSDELSEVSAFQPEEQIQTKPESKSLPQEKSQPEVSEDDLFPDFDPQPIAPVAAAATETAQKKPNSETTVAPAVLRPESGASESRYAQPAERAESKAAGAHEIDNLSLGDLSALDDGLDLDKPIPLFSEEPVPAEPKPVKVAKVAKKPKPAKTAPVEEAKPTVAKQEPKPAKEPVPETADMFTDAASHAYSGEMPDPENVLAITVLAKAEKPIGGNMLRQLVEACGMNFGDMDIFHRHEDGLKTGSVQFSMANAVKPGTFQLSDMDTIETRGLTFFMSMEEPKDVMNAFECMLATAETVARHTESELLDEHRSVLRPQTKDYYRQRIRDFEMRNLPRRSH